MKTKIFGEFAWKSPFNGACIHADIVEIVEDSEDQKIVRYETETTRAGGLKPLVKLKKCSKNWCAYFLTAVALEEDVVIFTNQGTKLEYVTLPNMSYCRFENTLGDLRDCYEALENLTPESISEMSTVQLIELCEEINSLVED